MLLFQKRFHAGLVSGTVTLTFRFWEKPRVKPGGRYRCHPIGVLEVDAIERITLSHITEHDAQRAGFSSKNELLEFMRPVAQSELLPGTEVYRVALRHGGDGDRVVGALDSTLSTTDFDVLAQKLKKMDEKANTPWTRKVLRLIEKHPRIAASQLAAKLKKEKADFKADVVKLKKLGLTQSFEVGYELSPRGMAFLQKTAHLVGK